MAFFMKIRLILDENQLVKDKKTNLTTKYINIELLNYFLSIKETHQEKTDGYLINQKISLALSYCITIKN